MNRKNVIRFLRRAFNMIFVTFIELCFVYFVAMSIAGAIMSLFGDSVIHLLDKNENGLSSIIQLDKEDFFYAFIHILCLGFYTISNVALIVERIIYIFTNKVGRNMRKAYE